MYLNVYVPRLQREAGVAGSSFSPRTPLCLQRADGPISKAFVGKLRHSAAQHAIPVVTFRKGERKDDVAAQYLSAFKAEEGVLFIGEAQEKARCFAPSGGAIRRRARLTLAGALHGDGQSVLRVRCGSSRFALANKGTDTRTIQAYLGHRNIQRTVRYTELAPGRFKGLFSD